MVRLKQSSGSIVSMIDKISTYMAWVVVGVFAAMMVLTAGDVFARFSFRRAIPGTVEVMSNYLMVAATFLPLAYGMIGGSGHITVDFLVSRLPPRLRFPLETIGLLLSLGIYSLIVWYTGIGALHAWKSGDTMVNVKLPLWPARALLPIGGFLLCVQIVLGIYRNVERLFQKEI